MARYIKANAKVAEFLKLQNDRNRVTDGNYLLWQADMLAFGRLTELPQILEQIGGLALLAHEAREEQDGTVVRKLPAAADPRFAVEEATGQPGDADTDTEADEEQENPEAQPEACEEAEAGDEPAEAADADDGEKTETGTNEETEAQP